MPNAGDAVFFTDAGPIPAWLVKGMAAALRLPCVCPAGHDPTVHAEGCARGDAITTLQERARVYRQENP